MLHDVARGTILRMPRFFPDDDANSTHQLSSSAANLPVPPAYDDWVMSTANTTAHP